ncbi:MAG: hypothetical protein WKF57_06545 [Nakamurella sp.]
MEPAALLGVAVIGATVAGLIIFVVALVRESRAQRTADLLHEDGTEHEWIRSQVTSEHDCGWTYCMCQVWECAVCYLTETVEVGCDEVR